MGFNKIILEGHITKDISLRYSQSGMAMASSSIAVSKKFTKNGEKKEQTLFVNLKFWGNSAEIFNQYCRKGSHILIDGELVNNNWVDANGNKKYDFEVHVSNLQMLDSKQDNQNQGGQQYQQQSAPQQSAQQPKQQAPLHEDMDEIPF